MAESRVCSSNNAETEIIAIKETLQTQQQLLQNLYIELEEEREASATAASEALSMILRLQGERSREKMEAIQYKRMAEEKMHHAEESLGMFEELLYQKEMEIASLEFQIQAYKYKLLSMGLRLPENRFLERNETQFGDLGAYGNVRRNNSLPAIGFKDFYAKKVNVERGLRVLPVELYPREIHEDPNLEFDVESEEMQKCSEESVAGGLNSYEEQIKRLDERVKEFSNGKDIDRGNESDWVESNQGLRPTIRGSVGTNLDREGTFSCSSSQANDPDNTLGSKVIGNATHSICIHDVFEVPQNHENQIICGSKNQDQENMILEGKNRLEKPNSIPKRNVECYFEDKDQSVKELLQYSHLDSKMSKPRDGVIADCHLCLEEPIVVVASTHAEVQKLNKQLEKVEGERIGKQKVIYREEEELRLLREIHEKLDSIKSEIKNSRPIKRPQRPPVDESSLVSLMEAMLLYSL